MAGPYGRDEAAGDGAVHADFVVAGAEECIDPLVSGEAVREGC